MKTRSTKLIMLCLTIFIFISCSDNNNDVSKTIQENIEGNIISGKWKITKFIDSGKDETNSYLNYIFVFLSDNSLKANISTLEFVGAWDITDSNSSDDSIDDLDFNIFFSAPDDLNELSEDWDIISQTNTKIDLIHISGGNGGTDYLTFEKN